MEGLLVGGNTTAKRRPNKPYSLAPLCISHANFDSLSSICVRGGGICRMIWCERTSAIVLCDAGAASLAVTRWANTTRDPWVSIPLSFQDFLRPTSALLCARKTQQISLCKRSSNSGPLRYGTELSWLIMRFQESGLTSRIRVLLMRRLDALIRW
jgi:hypothetical protein